ncbi:MAG: hypothetical protein ABIQ89_01130 [Candidatus Saccharimonadales bacterium]
MTDALFLAAITGSSWGVFRDQNHDDEVLAEAAKAQLLHLTTASRFPDDERFLSSASSKRLLDRLNTINAKVYSLDGDNQPIAPGRLATVGAARTLGQRVASLHSALPGALHSVLPETFPQPFAELPLGNDELGVFADQAPTNDYEAIRVWGGLVVGNTIPETGIPESLTLASSVLQTFAARPRLS